MSTGSDVRAGRAYVEMTAKDSSFTKGLLKAEQRLKAFGGMVTRVGAGLVALGSAGFAPFFAFQKEAQGLGAELLDVHERTGIAIESLSALKYTAEQNGTTFESLSNGLKAMSRNIVNAGEAAQKTSKDIETLDFTTDAATSASGAARAFVDLGLSVSEIKRLDPEEQFKTIAEALSKVEHPTTRAALAQRIFGKAAIDLLPVLQSGRRGIEGFMKTAQELGIVMSEEDAIAADTLDDAMVDLNSQFKAIRVSIGNAVIPYFQAMVDWGKKTLPPVIDFIQKNRELIAGLFKGVVAAIAIGGALIAVGATIASIGAILGGVVTVMGVFSSVVAAMGAALGFLVTPLGLVIAGVSGLAAYFATATTSGRRLVGILVSGFKAMAAQVSDAFGAIVKAISSGDIEAAMRIGTSFMKLEWARTIGYLQSQWSGWVKFFYQLWSDITTGFSLAWSESVSNSVQILGAMWGNLQSGFDTVISNIKLGWIRTMGFMQKWWNNIFGTVTGGIAWVLEQLGLIEEGTAASIAKDNERANAAVDAQAVADQTAIIEESNRRQEEIAQQTADRRAAIAEEQERRRTEILKKYAAERARIEANTNQSIEAQASAVAAAEKEYQDALRASETAAANRAKGLKNPIPNDVEAGVDEAAAIAGVGGDGTAGAKSRGLFNAAAIQSLQSQDNPMDRVSRNTEEMAKRLERIQRRLDKGEPLVVGA